MKLNPFFRPEKTKPSAKKEWIGGIMLSWEWESTVNWIKAKVAKLRGKK